MNCKVCFYIKCEEQTTLAFGLITVFTEQVEGQTTLDTLRANFAQLSINITLS